MTDSRVDRFGTPVMVNPDDHDFEGKPQTVPDPRGEVGPESPENDLEPISGPLVRFLEKLLGTASPKTKPGVVVLSDDEQAERIVSNAALMAIASVVDEFITSDPKRVEVVPSDSFAAERTRVNTASPAQRIVGRQPDRLRVRIRNLEAAGGNSVFIGQSLEVTVDSGFELIGGEEIVLETRAPIYAIAETAAVAVVVLAEFAGSPS